MRRRVVSCIALSCVVVVTGCAGSGNGGGGGGGTNLNFTTTAQENIAGVSQFSYNSTTKTAYAADTADGNIYVINGTTHAIVTKIAMTSNNATKPANPVALALDETGNRVFVANKAGDNITVISGANNSIAQQVAPPGGLAPVAVHFDKTSSKLFVIAYAAGATDLDIYSVGARGINDDITLLNTVHLPNGFTLPTNGQALLHFDTSSQTLYLGYRLDKHLLSYNVTSGLTSTYTLSQNLVSLHLDRFGSWDVYANTTNQSGSGQDQTLIFRNGDLTRTPLTYSYPTGYSVIDAAPIRINGVAYVGSIVYSASANSSYVRMQDDNTFQVEPNSTYKTPILFPRGFDACLDDCGPTLPTFNIRVIEPTKYYLYSVLKAQF